jgi:hypothetical protein
VHFSQAGPDTASNLRRELLDDLARVSTHE